MVPIFSTLSLIPNEVFGISPPILSASIIEGNLDSIWYIIDNETTERIIYSFPEDIDPLLWESLIDGSHTITFYANDTLGNENLANISIIKDTSTSPTFPSNQIPPEDSWVIITVIGVGIGSVIAIGISLGYVLRKRSMLGRKNDIDITLYDRATNESPNNSNLSPRDGNSIILECPNCGWLMSSSAVKCYQCGKVRKD